MDKEAATCSYPECDRPVRAKSLCYTHYQQKRLGKPLAPIRVWKYADATCNGPVCDRRPVSNGLCETHYRQQLRGKELAAIVEPPTQCTGPECDREVFALGLCRGHYDQKRKYKKLELTPLRKRQPPLCTVMSCDKPSVRGGLCGMHAYRLRTRCEVGTAEMERPGGSRFRMPSGYVKVHQPTHSSANGDGYVLEHRLVMTEMLGRPLLPFENVHHVNGRRDDNRPENLELWVKAQPAGQRARDLAEWVAATYPDLVVSAQRRLDL